MHWSAVAGVVCVGACAARGTTPRASSSRARRAARVLIAPGATSGGRGCPRPRRAGRSSGTRGRSRTPAYRDRKSTRLNSSHLVISYAVFCLKKKKKNTTTHHKDRQK